MANKLIYSDDITELEKRNKEGYTQKELEEQIEFWLDDERVNLKQQTEGQIIAIADLGLWNGRKQGYKVLPSRMLSDILFIGSEDINTIYYDGHNVRKVATHHDGTNRILFREVKPNVNIDKLCERIYNGETISNKQLNYYTRSLRRYVKKIYGW